MCSAWSELWGGVCADEVHREREAASRERPSQGMAMRSQRSQQLQGRQ